MPLATLSGRHPEPPCWALLPNGPGGSHHGGHCAGIVRCFPALGQGPGAHCQRHALAHAGCSHDGHLLQAAGAWAFKYFYRNFHAFTTSLSPTPPIRCSTTRAFWAAAFAPCWAPTMRTRPRSSSPLCRSPPSCCRCALLLNPTASPPSILTFPIALPFPLPRCCSTSTPTSSRPCTRWVCIALLQHCSL